MKRNGLYYKRSNTIVDLPYVKDEYYGYRDTPDHFIRFGKVCDKSTKGAIKTSWVIFDHDKGKNVAVYAKPIKGLEWAATNRAVMTLSGQRGPRMIAKYSGIVYTAKP